VPTRRQPPAGSPHRRRRPGGPARAGCGLV